MSELFDKLEHQRPMPGTKARATFAQLMKRWGKIEVVKTEDIGGRPEVWLLVSGTGADAMFELQEPKP